MNGYSSNFKFSFKNATIIFIIAFFFLQGTFSFRIIGPAITIQRIFLVIIYIWIFGNLERQKLFLKSVKHKKYNLIIGIYLFICLYTAILRFDFNTIFGVLVDCFLPYFLFLYFLDYEIYEEKIIEYICKIILIVGIFGLVEYITKTNIFSYLTLTKDIIPESFRDGILRIRVTYGHPLAYGMFLIIFFPFCCYDVSKKQIYLFNRPIILFLVMINILLTGSRSSIGIFLVEIIVLAIITTRYKKGHTFLWIVACISFGSIIIILNYSNPIIQIILRQVCYVLDEIFDTNLALQYGGDALISSSSIARERLWKIFNYPGLNPILGQGVSNKMSFIIDNWKVTSIDNFYVNQYVKFAYPGLFTTLIMFGFYIIYTISAILKHHTHKALLLICLLSGCAYFGNLIVVDELSTIKYFFFLMALTTHIISNKKIKDNYNFV